MCDKECGTQVEFKRGVWDENGVRIPFEVRTGQKHNCPNTYPYECRGCGKLIYLDNKVLSWNNNKRRALDFGTDTYHFCHGNSEGPVKT